MAEINVSKDVNASVTLSEEEIEVLGKAHAILKKVSRELWQNDAEDTETFSYVSEAQDGLYYFLKKDCNVNVD